MDHHDATLSTTKFPVNSAKPWTLQNSFQANIV